MEGAHLEGANLQWANLQEAHLERAHLQETNLQETVLGHTTFEDTNLKEARGLETCRHQGASTLDFGTLAKSGILPESFLRGCGWPEDLIVTYRRS